MRLSNNELRARAAAFARDLLGARIQAMDYTHSLSDAEMPRYVLACDFRTWDLTSLETGERTAFTLPDLPKHIDKFAFLLGRNTRVFKDQDPANIKAAELVGALHDALEASGYTGHKLEVFLTRIDVDQFYGIEIEEFPARIAETALWMMDHLMNLWLSEAFGGYYPRIPLKKSPTILHGDALEVDWATVLPPERCSYVLGNPPFVEAKFQSDEQRAQVRRIAALGKSGGTLDSVAAWFLKAGEYVTRAANPTAPAPGGGSGAVGFALGKSDKATGSPALQVENGRGGGVAGPTARIAFVSTNSITQGEQVAQLWPLLFDRYGLEIAFAHRTFAWGSEARGKAAVHVVIIGFDLAQAARAEKRLFSYADVKGEPVETVHKALSPYLFDASGLGDPHLVVQEVSRPLNGKGLLLSGSQPIDDGYFTFEPDERAAFIAIEPRAEKFLRPYVAARDFLQGGERWVLVLKDASPTELRDMPEVRRRIAAVRSFRAQSKRDSTRAAANLPSRFSFELFPEDQFLVLPKVSSERREYMPIAMLSAPTVPSDLVFVLNESSLADFALLTSAMHMSWLRHIGGRLKSDYRYSIGLVYNTFPLPPGADGGKSPACQKNWIPSRKPSSTRAPRIRGRRWPRSTTPT